MKKRIQTTVSWMVGIHTFILCSIFIIEPDFYIKIILLSICFGVDAYLFSKFLFYWRKDKIQTIQEEKSDKHYDTIKSGCDEDICPLVKKEFPNTEFQHLAIREENSEREKFKIDRVLINDLLIEDLNYMENLFITLKNEDEIICIKKKGKQSLDKEETVQSFIKKYEDILCKRKIQQYFFVYVTSQKEITKVIYIDKNDIIHVYYLAKKAEI